MPKLKVLRPITALIFLLLIAAAQPASAFSDWEEVAESVEGNVFFIDYDTIEVDRADNDLVSVWEKIISPDKSWELDLLLFNFSDRTYRLLAIYEYDSNDRLINSDSTPSGWMHIAPGTIAQIVYQTLKDWLNR